MRHAVDYIAILTAISGLSVYAVSFGLSEQIDAVAPGWGRKTMSIIGLASIVASIILRTIQNPTPTQTTVVPTASGGTVEVKTVAKETTP